MNSEAAFPFFCHFIAEMLTDLRESMPSDQTKLHIVPPISSEWSLISILIVPIEKLLDQFRPSWTFLPRRADSPCFRDIEVGGVVLLEL